MIKDFSNSSYKSKSRINKDYRRKQFDNPYFDNSHKKDKVRGFNTKLYLKIILVIFLIYVVIYSDLFKVQTININGADLINKNELEQIVVEQLDSWRFFMLPQKNIFFISKKNITSAIAIKYGLDNIEIKRGWKKITINIKERVNYLIIKNIDKHFFIDKQGIVIKEITEAELNRYLTEFPVLNMPDEINIGTEAISEPMVEYILNLNDKINNLGIGISNYKSGGITEVSLITIAGWEAHFDINNDLDISIENMQMILNDKVKDQTQLEYIDLRFGDKLYYK